VGKTRGGSSFCKNGGIKKMLRRRGRVISQGRDDIIRQGIKGGPKYTQNNNLKRVDIVKMNPDPGKGTKL